VEPAFILRNLRQPTPTRAQGVLGPPVTFSQSLDLFNGSLILRGVWRWRLPIRLLLHPLLPLLHLLQDLLRGVRRRAGLEAGTVVWRRLLRRRLLFGLLLFAAAIGNASRCGGRRVRGLAGAQLNLSRDSSSFIAHHDDVISGALEQLGENVARLAGAVNAEDALIGAHSFNLCPGCGGDILEDLLQAGVCRFDAETLAIPYDGGLGRAVIRGPFGNLRRRRRHGFGSDWDGFNQGMGRAGAFAVVNRTLHWVVCGSRGLSRRFLGSDERRARNQGYTCGEKRNMEQAMARAFEIGRGPVAAARGRELVGCGLGMRRNVCAHGNRSIGRWQRPARLKGSYGCGKIDTASLY